MAVQLVKGNNAISIDNSGWVLFKRPHGTFYSIVTQAIADPAVNTQVLAFEKEVDNEGLIHSLTTGGGFYNSRVYVPTSGSYEICFSGIADLNAPGPAPKYIEIWLKVDGSSVAETNTRVCIPSTNTEMTVAVSLMVDLTAGQYIELGTWGDDTDCRWLYTQLTTATPARPDCPSVIMTVKKISSRLSYE